MTDDLQRRGLLASLAARHQALELDALRVIDRITARLELGRERHGVLDLAAPRDWRRERFEERLDALIYDVCEELALEDRARGELHEQARVEMLGEFAPDRQPTRISDESARIALADIDEDEPYAGWDVSDVGGEGGA